MSLSCKIRPFSSVLHNLYKLQTHIKLYTTNNTINDEQNDKGEELFPSPFIGMLPSETEEEFDMKASELPADHVWKFIRKFSKPTQDEQARSALKTTPKTNETKSNSDFYFRTHDRPSHRLFGMYYKMAHSEIEEFHEKGYISIHHSLEYCFSLFFHSFVNHFK